MKALTAVVVSVLGFGVLFYALRDYMPGALLIMGAAGFVVAYVARSVNADPQRGWPTLAVFATVGFMLTGFSAMVGAGWPLALGALFFLGLAIFCAVKWARLGKTTTNSVTGGKRFNAIAEAHEQSRAADLDRRRSDARGKMLEAQEQARQAQLKVGELERSNAALRQRIAALENDLDAAVNDPLFDQTTHRFYKPAN